ncbi:MAG: XdhC family protein [Stenomitos frigidus ULC029]
MVSFYQQLVIALRQGAVVLAMVIEVKGSVPREVGAMMLLCSDGSTIGTIGGGAGEARVIEQARQVLATGNKQPIDIDLSGNLNQVKQGICGGMMQVWLERWQGERAIALTNDIITFLQTGQSGSLVIPFAPDRSPHLAAPRSLHCLSSLTPASLEEPMTATLDSPAFILPLHPSPTLLVVGAGHVAIPLAQMAHLLDFRVVVQDDRPEFAHAQRFPDATVLAQPIDQAIDGLHAAQLYVALVTRGYQHDLAALRVLLPRSPVYIGMMGSQKRVKTVVQALQQECIPGLTPALMTAQLEHLYAPIGLDLGALTPAEIAVSICAELISVYRGGSGQALSTRCASAT